MGYGDDTNLGRTRFCEKCQEPLTFISQYNRWYCYNCKSYGSKDGSRGSKDVVPEKTKSRCPTCGDTLFFIKDYDSFFCYQCNAYQQPDDLPLTTEGGEVSEVEGYGSDVVTELLCGVCGIEVEEEWIKCPNCGTRLEGEMTDKPVTTPDDSPQDGLYQSRPHLDEEEVPGPASGTSRSKGLWEARHEGEYGWESSADSETHDWRSSASNERKEREQASQEERSDWEEGAMIETSEWRKKSYEERKAWVEGAESEESEREEDAVAERRAWEDPNEPVKSSSRTADIPDEHGCKLDQETAFLVDIFKDIFTGYLQEPMESLSFYKAKLKVLSKKSPPIRKMVIDDKGKVSIYVETTDFVTVLDGLTEIFDSLVETEAKITDRAKAMARAKKVMQPIVEEYEEELEDFGIIHQLLKGAFATRLPSGIPGFDEMLHGGIPNGASIIVQGATGGEKEMFANQFLNEGLLMEGSIMVAVTMISPNEWRSQMKSIGAKTRKYEKEGQVVVVDWYTHKNERVRSVEVKGPVILSSKSITNLEIAIDKAIKKIRSAPTKRAVIAVLSPAIKALGFDKVFGFAQSIRGKFKKYGITGMFLLEKKMHDEKVESSLHSVFDGVFDIERQRRGDSMLRKIGVLSLKGRTFESDYRELSLTRDGLVVKEKDDSQRGPIRL